MMYFYYLITILLSISLLIIIYGLKKGKKLFTCILKVVVVLALIGVVNSQDDIIPDDTVAVPNDIVVDSGTKPVIVPNLQRAAFALSDYLEEFMWRNNMAFFLSDNYTPYSFPNSTEVSA